MTASQFVEVVDEEALQRRVGGLADEVGGDYAGREPVLVGVLGGCVPFLADLVRHLDLPLEIDFLALTRFGTEGRVGIAMDTEISLQGRDVILVEDIVDTGLTLATLRRVMEIRGVASLSTVALLDKVTRRIVDVPLEYRGFEVGDEYLLGYGLDWTGRYRNVRSLWAVMDLGSFADAPESFAAVGFGTGNGAETGAGGR